MLSSLTSYLMNSTRSRWLPIVCILLVATLLRLYHIRQPFVDVFSWRQASTAMMAENFFLRNSNILYPEVNWTGPGPNYQGREFQTITYISALLYRIVGQQDWIGRGVAVLFGVWGIWALYQLVRRVWDEKHALAAAAMMTILPGCIFIDRSFLPDPVMVALVTTSLWMLVAYLQTNRNFYLLLAAIIACIAFLTKLPGLLAGFPMVYATIAMLAAKKELSVKRLSMMALVGIGVLLPVATYYLWARHLSLSYPPYHFAGSGNWLWDEGVKAWIQKKYFLENFYDILEYWLWGIAGIALVFIGLMFPPPNLHTKQVRLHNSSFVTTPWLFHWWLAGCAFYYFIGAQELVRNPWNFHIYDPVAAIFAGRALILLTTMAPVAAGGTVPVSFSRLAVILAITGFCSYRLLKTELYANYAERSYKLGLALAKVSKPEDLVVTIPEDIGDPVAIYYSKRRGWVFPPAIKHWAPKDLPQQDEESIKLLEDLRRQSADWFGIVATHYKDIQENHPLLAQHINKTCIKQSQTKDYVIYKILKSGEIADAHPVQNNMHMK
jgi:4-amino-4-deoxy-L-arabinose transferase-like glycosyltransferase